MANNFMPLDFLSLLEHERRWCELLLTVITIHTELRTIDTKCLADAVVILSLKRGTHAKQVIERVRSRGEKSLNEGRAVRARRDGGTN
jgi:hypothetical protein